MAVYRVEMRGEVREIYLIEAESEEDAKNRWHQGDLYVSEASGMEVYDVKEDD
jgi:hypothetical protein